MNWKDRIERAKKTGKFTFEDKQMAGCFLTCAMSEKFNFAIVYHSPKALRLGFKFRDIVESNNIKQTEATYKKIQRLKI